MVRRVFVLTACGFAALTAAACGKSSRITLNVWGTSDITDSRLFSELIRPRFEKAFPEYAIDYTAVGSGAAITKAIEKENAAIQSERVNLIIVHSPSLEKPFWEDGHSVEARGRSVWFNTYVIPGPSGDPAGVRAADGHNAVGAFVRIYEAGRAGKAGFVSRNDESGTNAKEQEIWRQAHEADASLEVHEVAAKRFIPWESGHVPSWYKESGQTQGENLKTTNACAPTDGCYTLVDKGTYLWQASHGESSNLQIASQENEAAAPGGLSELTNQFHAYVVKNAPNQAGAEDLLKFLVSEKFQAEVAKFPSSATEKPFIPDAFPGLLSSELPTVATPGSKVRIRASFVYLPPVPPAIEGMDVHLARSVGCTKEYRDVATQPTHLIGSEAGTVEFTDVPFGATKTCYAVSTGNFLDTDSNTQTLFSPRVNTALGPRRDGQVKPSGKQLR